LVGVGDEAAEVGVGVAAVLRGLAGHAPGALPRLDDLADGLCVATPVSRSLW
jgi:hypothetical protein